MFFLFPLFLRGLGSAETTIGLVVGLGQAASVVTRPMVGVLLDRHAHRRVLLWCGALNVLSCLPFLFLTRVGPALLAATVAHFVVWGALFAAYFTYASDLVPPARRAEGIAVFGVAGVLSNGIGPAIGEWVLAHCDWQAFFLVSAALGVVSIGVTAVLPFRPRRHVHAGALGVGEALRTMHASGIARVFVTMLLFGAGVDVALFYVAPFTRTVGLERASPFFAAYMGAAVATRLVGRRLLDDLGPYRVAGPSLVLFGLGLAILGLLPAPGILPLGGLACGAGAGTIFPVLTALALGRTPAEHQGSATSLMTAALDLGGLAGIPLCGALAEAAGYPRAFAMVAAVEVIACLLLATDPGRRVARTAATG